MIRRHYWHALPELVSRAERLADDAQCDRDGRALVVELGPGDSPFSRASEFVGWLPGNNLSLPHPACVYHQLDLSRDELPWDDGAVDFLYSRHTLEDLDDPVWCLSEIARVAKAGYIETPSAIAELCRGVDAPLDDNSPAPWRGYHHHRSLFWSSDGILNVAVKYPVVEHLHIDQAMLESLLNTGPEHWNFWYSWRGPLRFVHHCHEVTYTIGDRYSDLMNTAVHSSVRGVCHA